MIKKQYESLVQKVDTFYTQDGTPSLEWKDPSRTEMLWEQYDQLMKEWEAITIELYNTTLKVVDDKPIYAWHISYEIAKLKLALIEGVGESLADKAAPLFEEVSKIEAIFEKVNNEETA